MVHLKLKFRDTSIPMVAGDLPSVRAAKANTSGLAPADPKMSWPEPNLSLSLSLYIDIYMLALIKNRTVKILITKLAELA